MRRLRLDEVAGFERLQSLDDVSKRVAESSRTRDGASGGLQRPDLRELRLDRGQIMMRPALITASEYTLKVYGQGSRGGLSAEPKAGGRCRGPLAAILAQAHPVRAAERRRMGGSKRRSFEAGHRPKFLVVIDGTPESSRAVHFAARRSARTGASLIMLGIVSPPDNFEWLGVGDALRAEAEEEIVAQLDAAADHAKASAGVVPERIVKEGEPADAILELIAEDQDISFLVLAAATDSSGPGPLVTSIASKGGPTFPVPIVIVPGDLGDDAIDALAG